MIIRSFYSGSMEKTDLTPIISLFNDFFTTVYKQKIDRLLLVYPKRKSLDVDYQELERFDPELADKLVKEPDVVFDAAEKAIDEMNLALPSGERRFTPHVRLINVPSQEMLIENLNSKDINELVAFKAVVTKRTEVMNRVKIAVYRCQICDSMMRLPVTKNFTPPKRCDSCKKLALQQVDEESDFVDIQRAEVQELLERVSGGAPAARIELLFEDDLVNQVYPGENVELTGVLRLRPPLKIKQKQEMVYSRYIEVNNVKSLKKDFEEIDISKEEEKRIKEMAADPNIEKIIIESVAPSIYGHEEVKWAIALQLFGGTKGKTMKGGATIRDDIHVLLIGDPGLAKTRILNQSAEIAPKSIYVSGKTVSAVGLCIGGESLIALNDAGVFEIKEHVERNFKEGQEEIENAFSSGFESNIISLGSDFKLDHKRSAKIWKIKAPEKMHSIKTLRGKEIRLTPNTSVICMADGALSWKKASELKENDVIATSRKTVALKGKEIRVIDLIKNDNARVVSDSHAYITDMLAKKYGSLTSVAERYGMDREKLYNNRSKSQGVKLSLLKMMFEDAGIDASEINVEKIFLRYGMEYRVPRFLNPEVCYLAGLVAGDGDIHLEENTGFVRFHSVDQELLEKVKEISEKNFAITPKITKSGDRIPCAVIGSVIVAQILNELGVPAGEKSHRIDIPPVLTSAGEGCVKAYLRGIFDTDGWVSIGKNYSSSICLCTCSKKLAMKALLLLEWWGIVAKVRERKDKIGKISMIAGKVVQTKRTQFYLEMRGIENFRRFREFIGFNHTAKKAKLEILSAGSGENSHPNLDVVPVLPIMKQLRKKYKLPIDKMGKVFFYRSNPSRKKLLDIIKHLPECEEKGLFESLATSDIYWDHVVSITDEMPSEEWVYDLTVDGEHNFLANGIIVHNTVAAERDDLNEGGWTLKAGALVLASGGIAMIDEFDKIEDEDRAALHEAMESGQISIAKAGMVAKFKTKTSILAAANPKWGRFDLNKNLADQFAVSPTLLSRFDLIFPIVDVLDEEKDSKLAQYILDTHMGKDTVGMYERMVSKDILRKFIAYARRNVNPKLTKEASEKIREFYVDMRRKGKDTGSVAITPRYLEGLVRLAEANAKMRLSEEVEGRDSDTAIRLFNYVMKQIMTDKETGVLDVDVVIGKPKSERDKLQKVDSIMEIIRELLKTNDTADIDEVVERAGQAGISDHEAEKIIAQLKSKGEIYEKEHRQFKIVEGY